MKSEITITPISNILNHRVIDEDKIQIRSYDTNMDVFEFYNQRYQESRKSNLMNVSLYDDVIVEGDEKYKILRMLSK